MWPGSSQLLGWLRLCGRGLVKLLGWLRLCGRGLVSCLGGSGCVVWLGSSQVAWVVKAVWPRSSQLFGWFGLCCVAGV